MWGKKSQRDRRRAPRDRVQWVGHYSVAGDPETFPCTVENISHGGSGLVLRGGQTAREGQRLVINIERIGPTPVAMRIRGSARHVEEPGEDGIMSIGVLLNFDGPHEERIAKMLFTQ
jgi:c-di-GMP-binding flagellar brake protein YcgR